MNKQIICVLIISVLVLSGSSCKKKISKYPFNMHGMWYSGNESCGAFLEIQNWQNGNFFGDDGANCPEYEEVKGKVKYKKNVLYIGKEKFTIADEPVITSGNDTIQVPDQNTLGTVRTSKKYRVLATMKLVSEKTKFEFEKTYNFSKYIDY